MTEDIKKSEIYSPEVISENPFPTQEESGDFESSQKTGNEEYRNEKISNNELPRKKVAYELLSRVLNTKSKKILGEFSFTESGAIQIGKYANGVSGDVRITPNGITARNTSGLTTFSLDGDTGDAVFRGLIRAGSIIVDSIITGVVNVGNGNVIIDGANRRILVNDGDNNRILIGYHKNGF